MVSSRLIFHSRAGAKILILGFSALIDTSNRTRSFPLPVQPWAIASAPYFSAASTNSLAINGRARAVESG